MTCVIAALSLNYGNTIFVLTYLYLTARDHRFLPHSVYIEPNFPLEYVGNSPTRLLLEHEAQETVPHLGLHYTHHTNANSWGYLF